MENKKIDYNKTIRVMELTILEGKHYSRGRKIRLVKPSIGMRGFFQLDRNCWYDRDVYGSHINKVTGFSLDLFNRSSVRLGWRPSEQEGEFEILIYVHYNGRWVRSSREEDDIIAIVDTSKNSFSIEFERGELVYEVNDEEKRIRIPFKRGIGWMMWFYFGGKPRSPHTMTAKVNYVIE